VRSWYSDYHDEPNDHRTERELTRVLQPLTRRYVDWRLYAGTNTEVVEGEAPLRPHGRRRWRAAIRLPAGIAGVLMGKVVRRLGPIRTVHDRDDSQSSRLDAWESHHPVVAAHFPQLGATRNEESVLGVFVHGTRSCGVPALQELAHHLATPFVRYEHDTFRPVVENARELSDLVAQHVRAKHLLLVGHSWGGLVARLAAAYLRQAGTLPVVDVWTFGTPHHGTPLVSRGLEFAGIGPLGFWRKLALLSKLDVATDEEGNPIEDAVSATLSILLRSARLPPGIAIMAPGSEALAMIQNDWNTVTQRAVGGAANRDDPRGGYSVFLRRMTSEIFAGQPNDFIVGQSSSTGSTGPIVLAAPCSHSGYFRDSSVRQMLASAP
jgi:pimeloyl-ACP methyl ester carboxylesterase